MSFFLTALVIALFLLVCAFFAAVLVVYLTLGLVHMVDLGTAYFLAHALGWLGQAVNDAFRW